MHPNSVRLMEYFINHYVPRAPRRRVLEVGSARAPQYRRLFVPHHDYLGADIQNAPNVDCVLPADPYVSWRLETFDIVISGQTLEHVLDVHAFMSHLYEVCDKGSLLCLIAPWEWEVHRNPVDCWRILPDGMRWLLAQFGFEELEVFRSDRDTIGIGKRK